MKIVNKTNLDYSTIGMIIDNIIKNNYADTKYYGKVEWTILQIGSHKIKVQIRYLKRYVEWIFTEIGGNDESNRFIK